MPAQTPLRVGIVGCGLIAHVHARTYQKLGAEITWVYDVSPAALDTYAKQFKFRTAPSVAALADRNKIDVASVCSPPACHLENVLPLIEAGIPTLCEKPLAANVAGAETIATAVRRNPAVPFMVGFVHRFDSRIIELSKLVVSGRLGRPILFRNAFGHHGDMRGNSNVDPQLAGGGALTGNGSHSIDMFRWLVGEPTRVQAMAGTLGQELAVEDVGVMQLSLNEKAFGEVTSGFSLHFAPYRTEYYGTEGTAVVDNQDCLPPVLRYRLGKDAEWTTVDCSNRPDIFEGEIAYFLDCVKNGIAPTPTVEDGLQTARILAAAYRSVREGGSVTINAPAR